MWEIYKNEKLLIFFYLAKEAKIFDTTYVCDIVQSVFHYPLVIILYTFPCHLNAL